MIFALADVPLIYQGQEVSAQDLNNLAQNTEILDQIVYGPNPLFLSHWKFAPPSFFLTSASEDQKVLISTVPAVTYCGVILSPKRETFEYVPGMTEIKEVDTWRGAFIFREGMHTLRLGFQTFPVVDNQALPTNTVASKPAGADSASLFLIFRYTDVPIQELLNNSKYKNYARSWVYWSDVKSKYKQPHNPLLPSYSFRDADVGWKPNVSGGTIVSGLLRNGTQLVDGYAEYQVDLTQFDFVQGEIVTLKFKLALRDATQAPSVGGRRFYFSMVYANIDHNLSETPWQTLPTITGLSQLSTLVNNQKHLVSFFKKYDNPVRASLWDQVLAGTSNFPIFNGNTSAVSFAYLGMWGFHDAADINYFNAYAQEARYYTQKNFAVQDTITTSFLVNVNSQTAFTMQGILSNTATNAMSYRLPYLSLAATSPTLVTWSTPQGSALLDSQESAYNGTTNINSQVARQGPIHSIGSRTKGNVTYPPALALTNLSVKAVPNAVPLSETMFLKKASASATPSFGGFYFVRPSPIDGGVTYYGAKSGLILGTSTSFFYGSRTGKVIAGVGVYADQFNFTLVPQTNFPDRYYPGLYGTVLSGLDVHSVAYLTNDPAKYTDFSIDLKESANSEYPFTKASYISTIRIAEVAKKSSALVVSNFPRYTSFDQISYSGLMSTLNDINSKLNTIKSAIDLIDECRYIPVFWEKPQSMLKQYEKARFGDKNPNSLRVANFEELTVYLSKLRQSDYLVVRGKNISIGWGGFNKLYRDNPVDVFPAPLQFEFVNSQSLTSNVLETVIIGFSSLSGLQYGERYYLTGDVYYAAETMGVP